jgi:hypothetical protein
VHDLVLVALIHSVEDTDRMIEVVTDAVTSQRWIGYSGLGSGHRGVNVLKLQGKLMQAQAVRQAKQASTQARKLTCSVVGTVSRTASLKPRSSSWLSVRSSMTSRNPCRQGTKVSSTDQLASSNE